MPSQKPANGHISEEGGRLPGMKEITDLLNEMWVDYGRMNPAALKIHQAFVDEGETVLNDHIALRTLNLPHIGIEAMAKIFKNNGYKEAGDYVFTDKKLYAKHYEHPNEKLPKIFISELELEKMSPKVRKIMEACASMVTPAMADKPDFTMIGRPWEMSYATYEELAKESEYASWVAAYGFRPNHFTVNVNVLKKYNDLNKLNQFIENQGHKLNKSGGVIKGSPEVYLEQSSTMAAPIPVKFTDGTHSIPGCYYEFAKRYPMSNGKLYQGFVAKSADKIFESTNKM